MCCTVAQMYYEAKSVNTQLTYRYKQLERQKEILQAAWSAHKRLHRDAGLDLSETASRSSQTCDVSSSAGIRKRRQSAPEPLRSLQIDNAELVGVSRCLTTSRQIYHCQVANDSSSISVHGPPSSRLQTVSGAVFMRPNYNKFCDFGDDDWTAAHNSDVCASIEQPTSSHEPSPPTSPPCCIDESSCSTVFAPSSTVFEADRRSANLSTSAVDDDEDGLESLFGGDEWWASDQSWRWQCGSPASAIDEARPTQTSSDRFPTVDLLNDAAVGHFVHGTSIPLQVDCLLSESCSQCVETSHI